MRIENSVSFSFFFVVPVWRICSSLFPCNPWELSLILFLSCSTGMRNMQFFILLCVWKIGYLFLSLFLDGPKAITQQLLMDISVCVSSSLYCSKRKKKCFLIWVKDIRIKLTQDKMRQKWWWWWWSMCGSAALVVRSAWKSTELDIFRLKKADWCHLFQFLGHKIRSWKVEVEKYNWILIKTHHFIFMGLSNSINPYSSLVW